MMNKEEKLLKKLFVIAMGLFFSVTFLEGIVLCRNDRGPRMVIKEREVDFKEVKEGVTLKHVFIIGNTGNEPLKIISVRPG